MKKVLLSFQYVFHVDSHYAAAHLWDNLPSMQTWMCLCSVTLLVFFTTQTT